MELNQYLENLERKLIRSFDIKKGFSIGGAVYDFFAEYHLRNEKFLLVQKATVYAFENNEYCLVKHLPILDADALRVQLELTLKSALELVKPSTEHMSSVITLLILVDDAGACSEAALDAVRRYSYHRAFALGFKGWIDIRVLVVSLKEGVIATNRKGKQVVKVYGL